MALGIDREIYAFPREVDDPQAYKTRALMEAYCYSTAQTCALKKGNGVKKTNAVYPNGDCPDCGHALFWEKVTSSTYKKRHYHVLNKNAGKPRPSIYDRN